MSLSDIRLSYEESYGQLKDWLDAISKDLTHDALLKGTLTEKREQLAHYEVCMRNHCGLGMGRPYLPTSSAD